MAVREPKYQCDLCEYFHRDNSQISCETFKKIPEEIYHQHIIHDKTLPGQINNHSFQFHSFFESKRGGYYEEKARRLTEKMRGLPSIYISEEFEGYQSDLGIYQFIFPEKLSLIDLMTGVKSIFNVGEEVFFDLKNMEELSKMSPNKLIKKLYFHYETRGKGCKTFLTICCRFLPSIYVKYNYPNGVVNIALTLGHYFQQDIIFYLPKKGWLLTNNTGIIHSVEKKDKKIGTRILERYLIKESFDIQWDEKKELSNLDIEALKKDDRDEFVKLRYRIW